MKLKLVHEERMTGLLFGATMTEAERTPHSFTDTESINFSGHFLGILNNFQIQYWIFETHTNPLNAIFIWGKSLGRKYSRGSGVSSERTQEHEWSIYESSSWRNVIDWVAKKKVLESISRWAHFKEMCSGKLFCVKKNENFFFLA